MNFLTEKLGFEPELNQGLIASVVFHIALFLFAWFGVPHLFREEFIVQPSGIEAAILADITAAPKVDKASKKVTEKPKEAQKVQPTKKEAKPAPAKETPKEASAPPPEPTEEVAVVIPDKEKPKEEKKVEKKPEEKKTEKKPEKKPDEKKKKPAKEENDLDKILKDLTNAPAAEETPEKPKNKPAPAEVAESTGPQADQTAAVAMTASEQDGIKQQLIPCWAFDAGTPNPEQYVVTIRMRLDPGGAVLGTKILDSGRMGDPRFAAFARTAERSVRNPACTPIRFPPGKSWDEIDLVFDLGKAVNGGF